MFDELVIAPGAVLFAALQQLEATQRKILFVAGEDRSLIGTLTDGDVRRWILAGGDLDGCVVDVCNRDPFVVTDSADREALKGEMLARQVACVPVVDGRRRLRDAVFLESLVADGAGRSATKPIELPVVIMAGGRGTRLAPFTNVLPKPLIPLGDKTAIEVIIESFTAYGVKDFILSLNYKSKIIRSFFDELDPPYSIQYLLEDEPLGTVGALHQLADRVDRDLIVTNCDVIVRAEYDDLVCHHRRLANDITLVASLKRYSIPYGICEIDAEGALREIREKPSYNFLVNTGLYVLTPEVLKLIPAGEHYDVTDLIAHIRARGGRVGIYPIGEKAWIDIGEWAQYRSALTTFAGEQRRMPRP
jgi:dTDP-glucose pyrophosphorylase